MSDIKLAIEDVNAVVKQSLELVEHELDKAHITVVKALGEELPQVRLDRQKIRQVFVNLFMNAIYAMPQNGELTVTTYAKQLTEVGPSIGSSQTDQFRVGETVVIAEVDDTGSGLPEDTLTKIFDPFFTTKPTGQGTGLGLWVTRRIVELHGGTIVVRNRLEGGARAALMFKIA